MQGTIEGLIFHRRNETLLNETGVREMLDNADGP